MVMRLPPSMVVLALMVFGDDRLVTVIVAAPPQAKVTVPSKLPPPGRQASNAPSEQLAPVPVPTTHAKADAGAMASVAMSRAAAITAATSGLMSFRGQRSALASPGLSPH